MSIADFFAKEGEAAFRQIESETLEELLQEEMTSSSLLEVSVVVTERNRQLLAKNRKHNVWLHASFDVVYDRIQKGYQKSTPSLSPIIQKRILRLFTTVEWHSIKI